MTSKGSMGHEAQQEIEISKACEQQERCPMPRKTGKTLSQGKFKGVPITRVDANYLIWMVSVDHTEVQIAKAELKRRGTTIPLIQISNHAIDSASLRRLKLYREDRMKNEGIASWLHRIAVKVRKPNKVRVKYKRMTLVFDNTMAMPILKTVL